MNCLTFYRTAPYPDSPVLVSLSTGTGYALWSTMPAAQYRLLMEAVGEEDSDSTFYCDGVEYQCQDGWIHCSWVHPEEWGNSYPLVSIPTSHMSYY